jgi:hypothetical protein
VTRDVALPGLLEIRIRTGSDDAEEGRRRKVTTNGDDLELVYDKVNQTWACVSREWTSRKAR